MGPENEEIPDGEVNLDSRFVNLTNILGSGIGAERTGRKNALSLSAPDSADADCAALLGWANMPSI